MCIQWRNSDTIKTDLLAALVKRNEYMYFLTFIVYKDVFKLRQKKIGTQKYYISHGKEACQVICTQQLGIRFWGTRLTFVRSVQFAG